MFIDTNPLNTEQPLETLVHDNAIYIYMPRLLHSVVNSLGQTHNLEPKPLVVNDSLSPLLPCFDPRYLMQHNLVHKTAHGRGKVYFFKLPSSPLLALRHYRRGGLISKLVKDHFFYNGLSKTRAYQEMQMLLYMVNRGLHVPKPIASRVTRVGLAYTADIITEVIDDAHELHNLLTQKALTSDVWELIGYTIAQFHHHNIYHHDLNAKNILLQREQKVYLLDFDRCYVKPASIHKQHTVRDNRNDNDNTANKEVWKQANLARLKRSLNKLASAAGNSPYYFFEHDWQALLTGYQR